MKNHLHWLALSFLLLGSSLSPLLAQIPKTDLDEIKQALEMTSYAADPDAGAVILTDYGEAYIEEAGGDLQLKYTMYKRVKLFKESAFDLAEVEIPYYGVQGQQKVANIKAETYYLDGNKVKSYDLSKKDILKEEGSDGWESVKFTLPQVQEGTVFEYSYQIISETIRYIKPWYFQQYYPVAHSEYQTRIPEWYHFLPLFKGGMPLTDRQTSTYNRSFIQNTTTRTMASLRQAGQSTTNSQSITYKGEANTYIMDSVPAFVREPFMTTPADYLASLEFQLQSIAYPQQPIKPVLGSWDELAKGYMESPGFGERLNNGRVRKEIKDLALEGKSPEEQARLIFDFVRESMKWDGDYDDFADEALHTVFEQKEGSSGEINLILLDMLQEAGLDAQPVIISTRSHGKVQQIYPLASQFNHVIVLVNLESGPVLLDAISDFTPFGMLPESDLNDLGMVVFKDHASWVDIRPLHQEEAQYMANMKLDAEGTLSGSLSHSARGYAAVSARYRMSRVEADEKEYVQQYLVDDWSDIEVSEILTKAYEDREKPMEVSCQVTGTDYVNVVGEFMYVQPMLSVVQKENPFKLKVRTYPVDFGTPIHEKYIFNLMIPEGYVVEELPKTAKVVLPNGGGSFLYQAQAVGSMVQLMSDVSIQQTLFRPEEYEYIKAFFDHIVAKQNEQIVLKKSE